MKKDYVIKFISCVRTMWSMYIKSVFFKLKNYKLKLYESRSAKKEIKQNHVIQNSRNPVPIALEKIKTFPPNGL